MASKNYAWKLRQDYLTKIPFKLHHEVALHLRQ